jgi:serine/threonine protein kinase
MRMEYAERGSLAAVLTEARMGSKPALWNATGKGIIICGSVLGRRYIHSQGLIHRDLKPSNVLIRRDGDPLIGDFGVSCPASGNSSESDTGTVDYAAPEAFEERAIPTTKRDVFFSFGLVLYEILTETAVFRSDAHPLPVLHRLRNCDFPALPGQYGAFLQDLIDRCWRADPETRPPYDDILTDIQRNGCEFIPRADGAAIQRYVSALLAWESGYRYLG